MKSLNVKLVRSYRSKNGNVTFVYEVIGSKEMIAKYEELQGEFFRKSEEGVALWFTTRCIGNTGKLIITTNDKIVPDMSAFDQAESLAKQYGGNFGAEVAKAAAQRLVSGSGSNAPAAPEDAE
jgi:hypothetical protein